MDKNLYWSHGDKGGVGKSLLSAVLVDHLLQQGRDVGVIEGDTGADIAARFVDTGLDLQAVNLNRSGAAESAIIAFSDALEALRDKTDIVVNMPAGAGDTLEELAEVLTGVAESLGFVSWVFYSLGHQSSATKNAIRSLDAGLLGSVPESNRCAVYPAFLGNPESFDWVKSGARDRYNVREIVMPAIRPDALAVKVLSLSGPFSRMADKDSPLTLGERILFQKKWLWPALEAVAVFGGAK